MENAERLNNLIMWIAIFALAFVLITFLIISDQYNRKGFYQNKNTRMKKINWKKLRFTLSHLNFLWALPLTFGFAMLLWYFGHYFLGTVTIPDPGFIIPVSHVAVILIGIQAIVMGYMWFNCRGLYYYFFGYCDSDCRWINKSKDDFNSLHPWQRLLIYFSVLFFYTVLATLVWHWIGGTTQVILPTA